ncbi:MAG: Cytidylate kinase [Candidatus Heimdallarchaeota archaeon LC_3]|nr:MAG: Cytidylate kinase [Candidatus Heimdallarchaeota archaeon LC_3]
MLPFLFEKEKRLCLEHNLKLVDKPYTQLPGPVIAIGGYSGVGKDTLAHGLELLFKKRYKNDLKKVVAGTIMRKIARKYGFDEAHLDQFLAKLNLDKALEKEVDREMDERTLHKTITMGKGLFIGRMAPFVIGGWGFSIWVKTVPEIGARRILNDKHRPEYGKMGYDELLEKIIKRDIVDKDRLEKNYGVKLDSLIPECDLILDNSNSDINETLEIAFDATSRFYGFNDL